MASPRTQSSVTELVQTYLEDIHHRDPTFFKQLANKPQVNGRLFFNLTLASGTAIPFPDDTITSPLLMRTDTSQIDTLDHPVLSLAVIETIQRNAADIFSMVRCSFLEKLNDTLNTAEFSKLHHILAGALCYKIWCVKNAGQAQQDIIKAKIIAAVLSSSEDSTTTLSELTTKYTHLLKEKFNGIYDKLNQYLSTGNIKLTLATLTNLKNAIHDLSTNIEFCCLDGDYQHQIHRHINFRLKKLKTYSLLIDLKQQDRESIYTALGAIHAIDVDNEIYAANIDALTATQMHKGFSIETSTPSAAAAAAAATANKPSPRRQLTAASISPRSAAAAADISVAKSPLGFMSRNSVLQPKNAAESPRNPKTPANSPRQ